MARNDGPDLLELAEAVEAGRMTLQAAESRLAREAERRELRSLVRALGAIGEHAAASASIARASGDRLDVAPARLRPVMRERATRRTMFSTVAAALATVVVVALVIVVVQPPPLVGGPSPVPSLPPASAPLASPSAGSVPRATPVPATASPSVTPGPTAAAGLPEIRSEPLSGPNVAFWSLVAPDRLAIWLWDPLVTRFAERATVETWTGETIVRTVLFAPNGALFAIHEIDQATSSPVQRLRVFSYAGALAWEAPRLQYVTAMAWSPDGTALAIGSLPVPWTLVQFGDGSSAPDVTTYALDDQDGYALLGFSEDGATLYGYRTGGEAGYWEWLVAVDRATGTLRYLATTPIGPAALSDANSTAPVGQFDRGGGILALAGGARDEPHWVVRVGASEVEVPIDPSIQLAWGPDRSAIGLGGDAVSTGLAVNRFDPITGDAAALPDVAIPAGGYSGRLAGVRDGYALVLLTPFPAGDEGIPFGVTEAVLVELATGRLAVGLAPQGAGDQAFFTFAGWLGQRS